MGETAGRFLPWPGGGVPGNHSEGSPGDPLIPFPSRGKECLPGEGPRPQARKPCTVFFQSRKATRLPEAVKRKRQKRSRTPTAEETPHPKEAALTTELQGTALPQALRASSLREGA